jgi:hypothetical protein
VEIRHVRVRFDTRGFQQKKLQNIDSMQLKGGSVEFDVVIVMGSMIVVSFNL